MGLGVLEDRVMSHVPGTTRYFDDPERAQSADSALSSGLKCDTSGPIPIILHPQPSDDPNDPLNWPLWRRDLICFILSITAIFATCLGPILAADTLSLSTYFEKDFTYVAVLTGYFLLGVGAAAFFFVPSSRVWGKRHLFVLSTIVLALSSLWCGLSKKHYQSFLWSRIVQGIGCAPYESLVNVAVGDLYCVHQRGKRMAFTNLAVFGGCFFTPIIVGKIANTIGWWWSFYLVAIFCFLSFFLMFFFVPETAFRRDASLNTDMAAVSEGEEVKQINEDRRQAEPHGPVKKKTYRESLALFDGRKTDDHFWVLAFRPLPLFAQPAFLWACLTQGILIGWTVFLGVVLAAIFLGPPMWWNEVNTGYAYVGPFIGALLGFIISGLLADPSAKLMTKWNNGIYEPEFRIILVVPQLIFGCMGLWGFAISAEKALNSEINWVVPIVFFGFVLIGMVIGAVASSLYLVDAYRDLAIEGFTCTIIFKNVFSFALTFKAYDWLVEGGVRPIFMALGYVQLGVCLLAIPMYIFGKRNRSFFYRHDMLKALHLK